MASLSHPSLRTFTHAFTGNVSNLGMLDQCVLGLQGAATHLSSMGPRDKVFYFRYVTFLNTCENWISEWLTNMSWGYTDSAWVCTEVCRSLLSTRHNTVIHRTGHTPHKGHCLTGHWSQSVRVSPAGNFPSISGLMPILVLLFSSDEIILAPPAIHICLIYQKRRNPAGFSVHKISDWKILGS